MPYEIYLKDNIGNEIGNILNDIPKQLTVNTLSIQNGLLNKGSYYIPVDHILFIKEI